MGKPKRFVHIVYPAGTPPPLHVFTSSSTAYITAGSMLGVDVVTLPLEETLPAVVRDDLVSETYGDEDTQPRAVHADESGTVVIDVDDLD